MIGVLSTKDYIGAVANKLIPNIKVTVEDIKNAEKIFGKDFGAIMGKTTRSRPALVVSDVILLPPDILKAHKNVVLSADICFCEWDCFLHHHFTTHQVCDSGQAGGSEGTHNCQSSPLYTCTLPEARFCGGDVPHGQPVPVPSGSDDRKGG